ncbi:hypothetical protein chiPu_0012404 [Chiloscyllium punctatum]|uniref:Uncharacterized protein n=1 Tax=Chiloscyllium punctatum TaxID=137246 RepID=A0A401SU96_CHIPU|nr:hypothetical protein [Chiloscyllium punctatum]
MLARAHRSKERELRIKATDLGEGATDFEFVIDVQETVCAVNSGLDPSNCTLLTTPNAKTATCTSHVEVRRNESPFVMKHLHKDLLILRIGDITDNFYVRDMAEVEDTDIAGRDMVQDGGIGGGVAGADEGVTDGIATGTTEDTEKAGRTGESKIQI